MVRASKKDKEENKDIEKELQQIIELVNSANLEELEIREGKKRVRIKKKVVRVKE